MYSFIGSEPWKERDSEKMLSATFVSMKYSFACKRFFEWNKIIWNKTWISIAILFAFKVSKVRKFKENFKNYIFLIIICRNL